RSIVQSGSFDTKYAGPFKLDLSFTVGDFAEMSGKFEMLFSVDGKVVQRDEVEIGGNTNHAYTIDLNLEKGSHSWQFESRPFDALALRKALKGDKPNVMNPFLRGRLTGPIGTGIYEYPKAHQRIFFNGAAPDDPAARRNYAREIIKRLADRA